MPVLSHNLEQQIATRNSDIVSISFQPRQKLTGSKKDSFTKREYANLHKIIHSLFNGGLKYQTESRFSNTLKFARDNNYHLASFYGFDHKNRPQWKFREVTPEFFKDTAMQKFGDNSYVSPMKAMEEDTEKYPLAFIQQHDWNLKRRFKRNGVGKVLGQLVQSISIALYSPSISEAQKTELTATKQIINELMKMLTNYYIDIKWAKM